MAVGFASIDNLVKGAAGQALQNANLMLGLEETAGPRRAARERAMKTSTTTETTTEAGKSFSLPRGFRFGAVAAGIREAGGTRKEIPLALVLSDLPAATAGVFTVNKMCAAPIRYAAARLPASGIRAIVANSGNANALTGTAGSADERAMAEAVARTVGCAVEDVLTASTGAIGVRMPIERITAAAPALVAALGDDLIPAGYIESYTAGIDHDFRDFKFTAAYVATAGVHLAAVYSPNSYGGADPAFAPFTQFDYRETRLEGWAGERDDQPLAFHLSCSAVRRQQEFRAPRSWPAGQLHLFQID